MSSIHRVGVTIAGIATVVTVAGAFFLQGYTSAQQAQAQATAAPTATAALAPETVYINPVPTPGTPAPVPTAPVIHVVVPGFGDDGGGTDH